MLVNRLNNIIIFLSSFPIIKNEVKIEKKKKVTTNVIEKLIATATQISGSSGKSPARMKRLYQNSMLVSLSYKFEP